MLQKFRRNHFKRFKTEAERLNRGGVDNQEYDILSNQLDGICRKFDERLGIKPGDIDLVD